MAGHAARTLAAQAAAAPAAAVMSRVTTAQYACESNAGDTPSKASTGADAATAPAITPGYDMRIHADSLPPYEPPKAMTGCTAPSTDVCK